MTDSASGHSLKRPERRAQGPRIEGPTTLHMMSATHGPHHSPAQPQWEGVELAMVGNILTSKMVLSSKRHSGTLWGAGDGPTQRMVCAIEKSKKAQQDMGPPPLSSGIIALQHCLFQGRHSSILPINPIMIYQRKRYTPATDSDKNPYCHEAYRQG